MPRYRLRLPQLDGRLMVTDGGIETTLIFHEGLDLPLFAAFPLLAEPDGRAALRRYFDGYARVAAEHGLGLVLESPTWRASPRWADQLGYSAAELVDLNRRAIALLEEVRDALDAEVDPIVISGCVGPHDDGYRPETLLSPDEAEAYHATQIRTFAATEVDMTCAITMTYAAEAIGVTRATRAAGLPVAISFTVETDGRLPSGQALPGAIAEVDEQTGGGPDYYMLNCAHPTHFEHVLEPGAPWLDRILGLRANASRRSHAELDEATELDEGDPAELAAQYAALRGRLGSLAVLGGCCGTDVRHVGAVCAAWTGRE